ncbi:hypothetical protein AB0M39_21085 [Streptomyces sp. NPDC051907]|uniref:hypothetical protein n=1 Tax=Streptomyces sp. NPDC051907 TaxID=3155284 RepID=UPI00343F3EE1
MPRARPPKWVIGMLACAVVAVTVIAVVVSMSISEDAQRSDNADQLRRACKGLLPHQQLEEFVSSDDDGVLDEYGTMLDPRQESRALLDCRLAWGEGRWEPEAEVRVRAEALVGGQAADSEETSASDPSQDFSLPLPAGAKGSTSADERVKGSEATASLQVTCPNGLRGRLRPSKDLRVTVALPSRADSEYDVPESDRFLAAQTAVHVANWVAEQQKCGLAPISAEGASPAKRQAAAPTKQCAWLDPEALEFAEGGWEESDSRYNWDFSGDTAYNRNAGSCEGALNGLPSFSSDKPIVAVRAESWSGDFAVGAYQRYEDAGKAPGRKPSRTAPDGTAKIKNTEQPVALALWAEATCDGGRSYHRVAVTPYLQFGSDGKAPALVLDKAERERLSTDARAVLDRYLAAEDGWAQRSNCRKVKVVGEVEEWTG